MSENTKIEWATHTFNFNPWIGCDKVSPACDHCYAERFAARFGQTWGAERRRTSAKNWRLPIKWNRHAEIQFNAWHRFQFDNGLSDDEMIEGHGFIKPTRPRVFCASLADVFDNQVPAPWRHDLFNLIHATPYLDWLLLTKRGSNAAKMLPWMADPTSLAPWPNVWLGISVANQDEADRDIPKLLAIPAAKRFLSIEPMLGPIDLERPRTGIDLDQGGGGLICQPWLIQSGIDWIICGGESGPKARPLHPDWVRSLRDQCQAAEVPFFFKQWGEWVEIDGLRCQGHPLASASDWGPGVCWLTITGEKISLNDPRCSGVCRPSVWGADVLIKRIGRQATGRHLDGRTHDAFPP